MSQINTLFKETYIRLTINNSKLTEILSDPFEKYAPLKLKKVRRNQTPFMKKKQQIDNGKIQNSKEMKENF